MKKFFRPLFLAIGILSCSHMLGFAQDAAAAPSSRKEGITVVQTIPEDLELVAIGTVKAVPKSDQIVFNDGKSYAIDNIRVPVHMEQTVREYLAKFLIGKKVGMFVNEGLKNNHNDSFGNLLVHVMTEDGNWVQANLVSMGYAWVFTPETSRDLVKPLYQYEEMARRKKVGLWRIPENAVKYDNTITGTEGSFQIYEGVVKGFRVGNGYSYVNFGNNPATDFTILIKSSVSATLPKNFGDTVLGQRVRIRGWVEDISGPAIYMTHPEQLEILGRPPVLLQLSPCPRATPSTPENPCQEPGAPATMLVPAESVPQGAVLAPKAATP